MIPGTMNPKEIKNDFHSKVLNINMDFINYWTCLKSYYVSKSKSGGQRYQGRN